MSATSSMFEASLGETTELTREHELVHSTNRCGSLEPRWWVVDIGVRACVHNTSGAAIGRPGCADFNRPEFGSHAPLHLRIDAGITDGRMGSSRRWLVDATSTRAYVFASTVSVHLVGPDSLVPYLRGRDLSLSSTRNVFARILAGLWPVDPGPGFVGRGCNCSLRVRVPANATNVAARIPPGARTLAIFDRSGSNSPWTWQLGEAPSERRGPIVLLDGQSLAPVLVPNFTHVAPAAAVPQDRDVLLVFGVDL